MRIHLLAICIAMAIPAIRATSEITFSDPYAKAAFQDPLSNSVCYVHSDFQGTGVLIEVDGKLCVLTAAHNTNPTNIAFFDSTTEFGKKWYEVQRAVSFQHLGQRFIASDIQVLFLKECPADRQPLTLADRFDPETPSMIVGSGLLWSRFFDEQHPRLGKSIWRLPVPSIEKPDAFWPDNCISKVMLPKGVQYNRVSRVSRWWDNLNASNNKLHTPFGFDTSGYLPRPLIEFATRYNPETLETHTGHGFSGGPIIQNEKVVALQVASERFDIEFIKKARRISAGIIAAVGVAYTLNIWPKSILSKGLAWAGLGLNILFAKMVFSPTQMTTVSLQDLAFRNWLRQVLSESENNS